VRILLREVRFLLSVCKSLFSHIFGRIGRERLSCRGKRAWITVNSLIFPLTEVLNPAYFPYVTGNVAHKRWETATFRSQTLISRECQTWLNPAYSTGVTGNIRPGISYSRCVKRWETGCKTVIKSYPECENQACLQVEVQHRRSPPVSISGLIFTVLHTPRLWTVKHRRAVCAEVSLNIPQRWDTRLWAQGSSLLAHSWSTRWGIGTTLHIIFSNDRMAGRKGTLCAHVPNLR